MATILTFGAIPFAFVLTFGLIFTPSFLQILHKELKLLWQMLVYIWGWYWLAFLLHLFKFLLESFLYIS